MDMKAMRKTGLVALATLALGACGAVEDVQSLVKSAQQGDGNEFRPVRGQPLAMPKAFELRPPREGGADLRRARSTAAQARRTITGKTNPEGEQAPAGAGERALINRARGGSVRADSLKPKK